MAYVEGEMPIFTGNNNSGFGNGDGWWVIILFALIFGWGRNGYGSGFGGSGSGAADNYVLASDFATLQRQLSDGFNGLERKGDSINNGLCDGFYAVAQQFATTNSNIASSQYNLTSAITAGGYETRNAINDVSRQLSDCCCKTQRAIDGINNNISSQIANVNYNMATNTCSLKNELSNSTRDIIASQKAGTDAILGFLTNEKISSLQAENASLKASISNDAQTATLLNAINRTPVPAYNVPNPYCCYNSCGCNSCGSVV